ncbi:MAG: 30S ribosomal protein S9 [archaeon]
MAKKRIPEFAKGKITVTGKRKTAIAKATICSGTGIVKINKIPVENLGFLRKLTVSEPIRIAEETLKSKPSFDIFVNVSGGGPESQIEVARLSIAKAIVAFTKNAELKKAFLSYDRSLLVADARRKEQYKPNDSKARAKRQKSYR